MASLLPFDAPHQATLHQLQQHAASPAVSSGSHDGNSSDGTRQLKAGKGSRGPRPRLFGKEACQADGCTNSLKGLPFYNKRNHICMEHKTADFFYRLGDMVRFCQRCGIPHPLVDFDGVKKSCRRMLEKHNARRRKAEGAVAAPAIAPVATPVSMPAPVAAPKPTAAATASPASPTAVLAVPAFSSASLSSAYGAQPASSAAGSAYVPPLPALSDNSFGLADGLDLGSMELLSPEELSGLASDSMEDDSLEALLLGERETTPPHLPPPPAIALPELRGATSEHMLSPQAAGSSSSAAPLAVLSHERVCGANADGCVCCSCCGAVASCCCCCGDSISSSSSSSADVERWLGASGSTWPVSSSNAAATTAVAEVALAALLQQQLVRAQVLLAVAAALVVQQQEQDAALEVLLPLGLMAA